MRVLYIGDPGTQGGAALAFIEVVSQMKKKGVGVIVCTSITNDFNTQLDKLGIENIAIGHESVLEPISPYKWKRPIKYPIRWLNYRIHLKQALNRIQNQVDLNRIDLIHTNSARNDVGCFLNKLYGIPHIMHIREFADADFNCISYRNNYIEEFNKYTTKFVAISNAVKAHWIKKGLQEENVIQIYDGVEYKSIKQSSTEDKQRTDLHMVMTSGICEPKGQHLVVEALHFLPLDIMQHVFVDFIGWDDPRYVERLKASIESYELGNNFKFRGAMHRATKVLGEYQVGLMCSLSEGFGRVTAEYMFAQLGVIASNSGANPELIENGVNGLLFESGNAKSLAGCIERFYKDRQLLVNCSVNAFLKAQNEYTEEINAQNIYKLYLDALR